MFNQLEATCFRNIILHCIEGADIVPIPEELSYDRVYQIARENQLEMMLGQYLLDSHILDDEVTANWKGYCLNKILRSANQLNEFKKVQEAFEAEKVKNLPLKGVYMKQYYGKPELRQMADLDICVEESELRHVQEILENLGYTLYMSVKNHDVYKKGRELEVEIHKCLFKQELDKKQHDYFGCLERSVLDEGKQYCYHQTLEDFYIYMIAHMAGHFYERGCGIRNLVDIYVFLKRFEKSLNRVYIRESLKDCGLADFEQHVRKLSDMWLKDGLIKKEFYCNLFGFMMNCGVYGKEQYGVWKEYAKCYNDKKSINAKNMKKWYIFPPLDYMKKDFPILKKMSILLPIFWLYRIARGVICKRGMERREYMNSVEENNISIIQDIYYQMHFDFEEVKS